MKKKSKCKRNKEASTPMPQQKHRASELRKGKPRAERVGTQKSVTHDIGLAYKRTTDQDTLSGPRSAGWAEESGSPQRRKAVWELQGSRAAPRLRPSLGGKGWDQHKWEDNAKSERGDPGNDPSQINRKDGIKGKKKPEGDGATPRRELRG